MKLTRFETDWRVWLRIGVILFLVSWFLPIIGVGKSGDPGCPAILLLFTFFSARFESDATMEVVTFFGMAFALFGILSAIISFTIAWFLHCAVVIVRNRRERKRHDAGLTAEGM